MVRSMAVFPDKCSLAFCKLQAIFTGKTCAFFAVYLCGKYNSDYVIYVLRLLGILGLVGNTLSPGEQSSCLKGMCGN
jgi:hypothetical protein